MKKSFLSKIILSLGLVSLLTLSSCIYNNDSYLDAFDKFVTEVEKAEKDGKIDETTWKNYESKFEEFDESEKYQKYRDDLNDEQTQRLWEIKTRYAKVYANQSLKGLDDVINKTKNQLKGILNGLGVEDEEEEE